MCPRWASGTGGKRGGGRPLNPFATTWIVGGLPAPGSCLPPEDAPGLRPPLGERWAGRAPGAVV